MLLLGGCTAALVWHRCGERPPPLKLFHRASLPAFTACLHSPRPVCFPSCTVDMHVLGTAPHPILLQDVVYYFKPTKTVTVTASLCGSSALASTFDARLYLLAGVDGGGTLKAAACSNDACGKLPALTVGGKAVRAGQG